MFDEEKNLLYGDVSLDDLRRVLPRKYDLDYMETTHLMMIREHVMNLLDENFPEPYKNAEKLYLGHLGATEVLEYLPKK